MSTLASQHSASSTADEISDADFNTLPELAYKDFGLHLPLEKKQLVFSRLRPRIKKAGLTSFTDYCSHILSEAGGAERDRMLSALTTNVSHFFREKHHFELLANDVLPPLIKLARRGGRVRLWSAACSAGQEPYSIAICVLKQCPEANNLDIKILGTDIDAEILETAKQGVYDQQDLMRLPEEYEGYVTPSLDSASLVEVREDVKSLVSFAKLNLVDVWPQTRSFDAIFCRNVAIYFDQETQARLWKNLSGRMADGGHLFIGHSERLSPDQQPNFTQVGMTSFQKCAASTQMNIDKGKT